MITAKNYLFNALRLMPVFVATITTLCCATHAADWPMFGRDKTRNPVSPEKNPPIEWDIKTGQNIKWKAKLGGYTFSSPVVANGLVWIGTNNEQPRDPSQTGLAGVLMCFREADGEFLYQYLSPASQGPTYNQARTGNPSSPLIEGDQLWFVTTRAEVLCLDIGPLRRGEGQPRELWKRDLIDKFGVSPRPAVMGGGGICSIGASYQDLIYIITGNGTDRDGTTVPSPMAPDLLCLNKHTGKMIWEDHSPGTNILFGEWGSPLIIEVEGRGQVIAPQGDGWIRSFNALTGELIWKFDINPKNGKWIETRGFFSTAPVFYRNRIYIATGTYLEFGEMPGRLCCIDPRKKGDISLELDDGPGKGKPNPDSGAVWHFDGILKTMSTVAIHNGLVVAPDFGGIVHCLDADTGESYWTHDLRAHVLGSPLIVDGKVYVGNEDGDVSVLALAKEKLLLAKPVNFESWIPSSPIFANGVLYLAAGDMLYAIEEKSGSWPQWRGPDRSNRSSETGLLKSWPTNGPPLLWKVSGLGTGIAPVSVAAGRVYTVGYRESNEFVFAMDAKTGEGRWTAHLGPAVKEDALMRWLTQRTPTVDEDRLYALTARGELICLRTSNGEKVWQKSYLKDFFSKRRIWGFSDYPLVDGEKLICSPVGTNATVVALNKRTGDIIWKTLVPGNELAGYAATVVSEAGGIRQYVVFLTKGLVGIAASDGRILWRYDRPATRTASSYTPIVQGDFIFSANGYGGGMSLLKLVREGNGMAAEEQYHQPFNFNPFQDSTALVGDYVYSIQGTDLPVCIEMKTGTLTWGPIGQASRGRAALTFADGHLYVRRSSGTMTLAEATPTEYIEKGSFIIPDREEASGVTSPLVAGGRLYLRDNSKLLCYDVSADALKKPRSEPKNVVVSLTADQTPTDETAGARPRTGKERAPDAIYVPTPQDIVEKMLELAAVKKSDVVYDLGSGDGRVMIAAAKKYGCNAVGYEIDERLVRESRESVQRNQVESLVRIEHEDLFKVDLSGADVIAVFLPPPLLERLRPQFEKLKPGARIVSHQFAIPGINPNKTITADSTEDGEKHGVHVWTTPLRKAP